MDQNYLAIYRDGSNWSFSWFGNEEEVQDWIDNDALSYSEVEVIEIRAVRTLYKNGFRISKI